MWKGMLALFIRHICVVVTYCNNRSNVYPCVPRRTLSRDESTVLESQIFLKQVFYVT